MSGICSAGTCHWCGCHFRRPSDVMYHRCAAMQQAKAGDSGEELVTGAAYGYVPQDVPVTDAMVERARLAGARWFAEHPDGASDDDEWRDHYRVVLMVAVEGCVD